MRNHDTAEVALQSGFLLLSSCSSNRDDGLVSPLEHAHASATVAEMEFDCCSAEYALANSSVHSRLMGATEHNWCRAVAGGTGITVLGLLFCRILQPSQVQQAIDSLQLLHPRLRSKLVWVNGRPGFLLSPNPFLKLEVITNAVKPPSSLAQREKEENPLPQSDGHVPYQENTQAEEYITAKHSGEGIVEPSRPVPQKETQETPALPCNSEKKTDEDSIDTQGDVAEDLSCVSRAESCLDCSTRRSADAETRQRLVPVVCSAETFADSAVKDNSKENSTDETQWIEICAEQGMESAEAENSHEDWLFHVENELNINIWPEELNSVEPVPMVVARLFHLPLQRSALILRLHTAVCDRVSAATIISDLIHSLAEAMGPYQKHNEIQQQNGSSPYKPDGYHVGRGSQFSTVQEKISSVRESEEEFGAIEDLIPRGQANKPFWAHGVDLLGYSLGSMRHASLPFLKPDLPRRSALIRSVLSVEQTDALLQACKKENTSLFGALGAAGLKAATAVKELGNQSEHFAIISLVDCRQLLDPLLPSSTVGFYHSAVLNTHHINEKTEFWSLARRCSDALNIAMKNRKHFTDMDNVNFLMSQAIQHPNLTPASSLRTSLLVLFRETVIDDSSEKDLKELVGLEEYMGCSSVHGVGPGLATFECIRNGSLQCTHVYPAPLHSRKQMQKVVNIMRDLLVSSCMARISQ